MWSVEEDGYFIAFCYSQSSVFFITQACTLCVKMMWNTTKLHIVYWEVYIFKNNIINPVLLLLYFYINGLMSMFVCMHVNVSKNLSLPDNCTQGLECFCVLLNKGKKCITVKMGTWYLDCFLPVECVNYNANKNC